MRSSTSRSAAAPRISVRRSSAKSSLHLLELAHDDVEQHLLGGQDLPQPGDELLHLGQLVEDLLPLQAGEALQLHLEDGLGLDLGEPEARDQPLARRVRGRAPADELDDLVDVVEGDLQPEQDVLAGPGLLQLEAGAPGDHVAPVGDEALQHLLQGEDARLAAVDGEQDDAEGGLQRGVLVEVVQDHLGHRVALQLDDDAHALARRTRRAGRRCPRCASPGPGRRCSRRAWPCSPGRGSR